MNVAECVEEEEDIDLLVALFVCWSSSVFSVFLCVHDMVIVNPNPNEGGLYVCSSSADDEVLRRVEGG